MTPRSAAAGAVLPWDAADPYPYYESCRRHGDVVWDETVQAWLVLGYHAARQVLSGSGWSVHTLTNPNAAGASESLSPEMVDMTQLSSQGADHRRWRGAVRDVFATSFIAGLTAGVEAIAAAVLELPPTGVVFDFMTEIAMPLPLSVAAEWLGLDTGTAQLLRRESSAIGRMLGAFADADSVEAGVEAFATVLTEFLPLAADRRAHPCDDLISFIAADPDLPLDEVATTAIIVAIAGHETTAATLGAGIIRLLTPGADGTRPIDYLDLEDPLLTTELLRIDAPVQAIAQTATESQMVGEVEIAAGETVLVVLAAANRDPTIYSEPDNFRPGRQEAASLTFGHGAHYCIGAALARLEIAVLLRQIVARSPALRGPATWRDNRAFRQPLSVPVVFGNAPTMSHPSGA